jgi:hypothetical protein
LFHTRLVTYTQIITIYYTHKCVRLRTLLLRIHSCHRCRARPVIINSVVVYIILQITFRQLQWQRQDTKTTARFDLFKISKYYLFIFFYQFFFFFLSFYYIIITIQTPFSWSFIFVHIIYIYIYILYTYRLFYALLLYENWVVHLFRHEMEYK